MPTYQYTAVDNTGKQIRGKMTAQNDLDMEERLSDLNLIPIDYKVKVHRGSLLSKGGINIKELVMLCVHLEQLDRAGVPLLDSIADLRDTADNPTFRDIMSELYENVKGGDMLSEALARRPDVFSEVFVGLVAAGEKTGQMAITFEHLASHYKWQADFRRSVKKAIRYPIALLVIMTGVISLMMLFVVPKLVDFLNSQGFDLPFYTQALISTSAAFEDYWYIILGLPIVGIIVLIMMYKRVEPMRLAIDRILLHTPAIGGVILKINLARFARFFSITFNSGIGVLDCLETAKKVVDNRVLQGTVTQIIQNVSEGSSLTRAIASTGQFPSLVVRMFKVGEDSGNMEEALQNINFFYDREVKDSVDAMVGFIQPALTIVMGILMFWVIAAIFNPLYSSFEKISF